MAVTSAGFKQQCPTCETMVLIKDPKQIGKKMECPKCKDRFVVEEPADETEEPKEPQGKGNGKAAPPAKPKKRFREDDVDDDDEGGEAAAKGNGKYRDEDDDDGAASKKKAGSKKTLPFLLAGVGLVVLVVAAVLIIMFRSDSPSSSPAPNPNPNPNPVATNVKPEEKKDAKGPEQGNVPVAGLSAAGAELTNLLPNETEHVLFVNFKELLDGGNPYRDLIFGAGVFQDEDLRRKLGFSLSALDTLIRADCYTKSPWTYTVLHFTESLDQKAISAAFGLQPAEPINKETYFNATRVNPWFEELSRLSLGVSNSQRNLVAKKNRALSVRFHNPQTLIVGDESPIVALLRSNSQFKLLTNPTPAAADQNPGMMPNMPGGMPNMQPPGTIQPGTVPPGNPMGMPPGAPPEGQPMLPKGGRGGAPMGGGAASLAPSEQLNFTSQDDDEVFGQPQVAQVAPTIIAPPLNMQGPAGQAPLGAQQPPMGQQGPRGSGPPEGFGPKGGMPMGGMPMGGMPGMPNMGMPGMQNPAGPAPSAVVRSEAWLTIDPALKGILDRLQHKFSDSKDRLIFASATDMAAARLDTSKMPEFKNRLLWHPRQLWDISQLLEERKPRIKALGTGLVQRDARAFQYRTEILCAAESETKELRKELVAKAAPQIARSIDRLLDHKIDIPKAEAPPAETQPGGFPGGVTAPMGMPPMGSMPPMGFTGPPQGAFPQGFGPMGGGFPGQMGLGGQGQQQQKEEIAKSSKLTIDIRGASIDMKLDLVLDAQGYARANNLIGLLAIALKSEVDLAGSAYSPHDFAFAVRLLGEKGLTDRQVAPGAYPPAALKRANAATRLDQQPYHRMSWLTGLLPHLGHDMLYNKIEFELSWRDPKNLVAAQAIVPQFLDPQYPDQARFTPEEMAATHVVGIAGVGLDAADYPRNDPAYAGKRGVFSYDGSASLAEIGKGRGLSNTAVAIQIPHDGPTGVSPWIAGGGATVRGVPETNSIAPFVLSTDRNGKPIQHGGKRGTNVTMADGSVRFVSAKVSDAVFQAMCTVNGPTPPDFDLNKNPETPLLPKQVAKVEERTPVAATPKEASGAANLSADAKAFHEGVVKTIGSLQAMELQGGIALAKAKDNPAEFDAALKKLLADEKTLLQQGRALKAPPGKEAQEYEAAFKAILDASEQSSQTDLPVVVEALRNPTPANQGKLVQLMQTKQPQQIALMKRLQDAQRAFLQATPAAAAAPQTLGQNGLPAGWKQFTVPGGGFSVALPADPQTIDQKTPDGKSVKVYLTIDAATQNIFTVLQMSGGEYAANPEQAFQGYTKGFTGTTGAKVVSEQAVTVGSAQGRDFHYQEPKLGKHIYTRAIATPGSLIVVSVTTDQAQPTGIVQAFLNSVKIGG